MCFAPYISLSTFIIEFLLAIYFLTRDPKDALNRLISLLSFMLGLYQLNEFLICTTQVPIFTILAMSVTAILPAIAITYALIVWRKKLRYYWHFLIYSPAIFFIVMFAVTTYYHESAQCMSVFIQYPPTGLIGQFYGTYYLVYIVAAILLFHLSSSSAKNIPEKRMSLLGMLGMFIFTIPTFIFLIYLPSMKIVFASVLCEFALLLSIELIIVLWYKDKHSLRYP